MSGVAFCFDTQQMTTAWTDYERVALKNAGPAERAHQRRMIEKFLSHPAAHKLRIDFSRTGASKPAPIETADLDAVQTVAFEDPPRGRLIYSATDAKALIRAHAVAARPANTASGIYQESAAGAVSTAGGSHSVTPLPPPLEEPFDPTEGGTP